MAKIYKIIQMQDVNVDVARPGKASVISTMNNTTRQNMADPHTRHKPRAFYFPSFLTGYNCTLGGGVVISYSLHSDFLLATHSTSEKKNVVLDITEDEKKKISEITVTH